MDLTSLPLPAGVRHSEFSGTSGGAVEDVKEEDGGLAKTGFAYLKRDLVRLLGILCWRKKYVQDRIRLCGGIPVVMNLCVVDERNPCELVVVLSAFQTISIQAELVAQC
jgi:Spinocerebellar ataxia type 10 protein domain